MSDYLAACSAYLPQCHRQGTNPVTEASYRGVDPLLAAIMSTRDEIEKQRGVTEGLHAAIDETSDVVSSQILI